MCRRVDPPGSRRPVTATRPDTRVLDGHLRSEEDRCLPYAPPAEALTSHRSVGAGLDLDRPRHLFYLVRLG
jgi:hypothetical protein